MRSVPNWMDRAVPFKVHGDGGVWTDDDTLSVLSCGPLLPSSNTLWEMLFLFTVFPKSLTCKKQQHGCDTEEELWRVFAWSLNLAFDNKHTELNHIGNPWVHSCHEPVQRGPIFPDGDFIVANFCFEAQLSSRPSSLLPSPSPPLSLSLSPPTFTHLHPPNRTPNHTSHHLTTKLRTVSKAAVRLCLPYALTATTFATSSNCRTGTRPHPASDARAISRTSPTWISGPMQFSSCIWCRCLVLPRVRTQFAPCGAPMSTLAQ